MSTQQFSPIYQNPVYQESNSSTTRFSSAPWFDFVQNHSVGICGVGGIGSWLVFLLSRLNPYQMWIMDDDVIDSTNLGGQLFRRTSIGQFKVNEVAYLTGMLSGYHDVNCFTRRLRDNDTIPNIVFGGFDNMAARKLLYTKWKLMVDDYKAPKRKDCLLIDGRLSAEFLQVFCISGDDDVYQDEYERKWLFSDEEAESTVCSYKQTSYCANLIASLMVNLYVNWCTNHCNPLIDRSVPFMTEYNAEQMFLKTEV